MHGFRRSGACRYRKKSRGDTQMGEEAVTVEDVERAVTRIRNMAGDDESAHSAEDGLWENVLRAIASKETDDPAAIAAAALKTKTIDFERWCA